MLTPSRPCPGLVVMGRDSRSKGGGFESRHRILDGHFSHLFVVKICNVCLKRPKINEKRPGLAHFYKKRILPVLSRHSIPSYKAGKFSSLRHACLARRRLQ